MDLLVGCCESLMQEEGCTTKNVSVLDLVKQFSTYFSSLPLLNVHAVSSFVEAMLHTVQIHCFKIKYHNSNVP